MLSHPKHAVCCHSRRRQLPLLCVNHYSGTLYGVCPPLLPRQLASCCSGGDCCFLVNSRPASPRKCQRRFRATPVKEFHWQETLLRLQRSKSKATMNEYKASSQVQDWRWDGEARSTEPISLGAMCPRSTKGMKTPGLINPSATQLWRLGNEEWNRQQPAATQVHRASASRAGPCRARREPINTPAGGKQRLPERICWGSRRAWCLCARLDEGILRSVVTNSWEQLSL